MRTRNGPSLSNAGVVRIGKPDFRSLRKTRSISLGETIHWSVSGEKIYDGTKLSKSPGRQGQRDPSARATQDGETSARAAGRKDGAKPRKLRRADVKKRPKIKSKAEIRRIALRVKATALRLEKRLREIRKSNARKRKLGIPLHPKRNSDARKVPSGWLEKYGVSKEDFIRTYLGLRQRW